MPLAVSVAQAGLLHVVRQMVDGSFQRQKWYSPAVENHDAHDCLSPASNGLSHVIHGVPVVSVTGTVVFVARANLIFGMCTNWDVSIL